MSNTRPIDAGVLWLVAREPAEHLEVALKALKADPEFDELVAAALAGDRSALIDELLAGAVIISHRVLLEGIESVIVLERVAGTPAPPPARPRRRWRLRRRR